MIELRPITAENWRKAIALELADGQDELCPSNTYSLAHAAVSPKFRPMGVYRGEEMVGFAMLGGPDDEGAHWIIRMMIDRGHQGQGYGKAATQEAIRLLRERDDGRSVIKLTVHTNNAVAQTLYRSCGFEDTGEMCHEDRLFRLEVGESRGGTL